MTQTPQEMTAGMHLPQAGPAASGASLTAAAVLSEELGFADVWVSDHLVVPTGVPYPPSAYVLEPLSVMTWVAAATSRVHIGTTVLVMPMRNPIVVAKSIATIDLLSEGRVILGTAAGWLRAEFDALGVPFEERGARTNEAIEMLRTMWTEDHITAEFPVHGASFESIRCKPQPSRHIPLWIGGHAPVALDRATSVGDGWHGGFISPQDSVPMIAHLRAARPEPEFAISMRTRWDPLEDDRRSILDEIEQYRAVGVNHVVAEPRQRTMSAYLESIEAMAEILVEAGVSMAT